MKQLTVDQDLCISCSLCVDLLPGVFRMTREGMSEVTDPRPLASAELAEALEECPVACISWRD